MILKPEIPESSSKFSKEDFSYENFEWFRKKWIKSKPFKNIKKLWILIPKDRSKTDMENLWNIYDKKVFKRQK